MKYVVFFNDGTYSSYDNEAECLYAYHDFLLDGFDAIGIGRFISLDSLDEFLNDEV